MSASLWVDASSTEAMQWTRLAEELSRLAFPDDVHQQLRQRLSEQAYVIEPSASGLTASVSTPEGLSFHVEVTGLTVGALVTVTYIIH